jgi:hypothetical protein
MSIPQETGQRRFQAGVDVIVILLVFLLLVQLGWDCKQSNKLQQSVVGEKPPSGWNAKTKLRQLEAPGLAFTARSSLEQRRANE